jgi:hypothetical protein
MINKRLSELSCNAQEFHKAKGPYEKAINNSGYQYKMEYERKVPTKRRRRRKIIWFNPPFSKNVKTNIGRKFMLLIKNHFPPQHKLHKIFNFNNVKISYSCMNNIKTIIQSHNANILTDSKTIKTADCNCRIKSSCPLNGNCRKRSIVYKATVTSNDTTATYYGLSEGEFKSRFYNHTKSFKLKKHSSDTELSKYIWELKDRNIPFKIAWEIEAKARPYVCGSGKCDLCTTEKVVIALADDDATLNKRSEIVSKCRHINKFLLKNRK